VLTAVKTPLFWIMMLMTGLLIILGLTMIANFKDYGTKKNITNDIILNSMGAIGAIANSLFRIIAGLVIYKFGFRKFLIGIGVNGFLVALTFPFVAKFQGSFFVWNFFIWCGYGGLVGAAPGIVTSIFGTVMGSQLFGIFNLGLN